MTREPPSKRQKLAEAEEVENFEVDVVEDVPASNNKDKFVPMYGNYRGYYSKRTGASGLDQRLQLVPEEWVKGKRVLDIGCNTGLITIQIAQRFHPYRVTGVDIDEDLIAGAQRQVDYAFSRQTPITDDSTIPPQPDHFPASFPRQLGLLPQPPGEYLRRYHQLSIDEQVQATKRRDGKVSRGQAPPREVRLFPRNIRLQHADWTMNDIDDDRKGYDLILALSVIKWIHINNSDQGLKNFFAKVFKSLRPNGQFIFEPQPWSSYKKCKRLDPKLKASYEQLQIRPTDFERILTQEIGFASVEALGSPGRGGFQRDIYVAKMPKGVWM